MRIWALGFIGSKRLGFRVGRGLGPAKRPKTHGLLPGDRISSAGIAESSGCGVCLMAEGTGTDLGLRDPTKIYPQRYSIHLRGTVGLKV